MVSIFESNKAVGYHSLSEGINDWNTPFEIYMEWCLKMAWHLLYVFFQILCIHLLRASVSLDGNLVKRGVSMKRHFKHCICVWTVAEWSILWLQGHVSFPVLLDLSPFAGGTFSTGQGHGPSATNMQIYDLPSRHLYRQLNAQMPINMFPTGGNSSSQLCKDEVSNGGGRSLYKACCLLSNNFILDFSMDNDDNCIPHQLSKFYLSDKFIYFLSLFRKMLMWVRVLRHRGQHHSRQGRSYTLSQLSLSTTVYAEVGIMQLIGE